MDIKQINQEYNKFNTIKIKIEQNISKFEKDINKLGSEKGYYKHLETNPKLAKKIGLNPTQIKAELAKIDTQLKDCKEKLQKQKEALQKFKDDLDKTIETVKQDPIMAETMDEILAKRYDRKMLKLEEKKEKIANEQKNMESLVMANRKNPFMENAIKDVLKLENDKKKLISDLNALSTSDPDYATKAAKLKTEIKDIENKEKANKKNIITAVKMEKAQFTEQDLDVALGRMGENMTILKNGDIQLDETLNRTLSSYKRQLNGIDKQVLTNSVAYAKLGRTIDNPKSKMAKDVQDKINEVEAQKLQQDIEDAKKAEKDKIIEAENKRRQSLVPAQKPKWFQFVKRFQQWRNSKKIAKMPSIEESLKTQIEDAEKKAEQDVIDANEKAKQAKIAQKASMRDALKYDVVQQVIAEQTSQKWADAKKTVKEAKEQNER